MKDSLKSTAYNWIRQRILNCEYEPLQLLDLNSISSELGISRTPVRDAITQLEQEEFVKVIPRHGVMVTGISVNKIYDISAARDLIEPYAVRIAAKTADEATLEHFRSRFEQESEDAMLADWEFHTYLVTLTKNEYVIQIMNRVLADNYRLVSIAATLPTRLRVSNKEHISIIDALLLRDPEKAEKAMRDHLVYARSSALEGAHYLSTEV